MGNRASEFIGVYGEKADLNRLGLCLQLSEGLAEKGQRAPSFSSLLAWPCAKRPWLNTWRQRDWPSQGSILSPRLTCWTFFPTEMTLWR